MLVINLFNISLFITHFFIMRKQKIETTKRHINDVELTLEEFENQGSRSFLNMKTQIINLSNNILNATNYHEIISFFVNESEDLESL